MPTKSLTLSIVIPAYNEERYLPACLDSILTQTVLADQIIVVDNNSTDKTAQVAKTYKVKVLSEPRQGVFFASVRGFKAASSDIIARIDADTILPPDWVKLVKNDLKSRNLAATTGPVSYYDMPFPRSNYIFDHFMRSTTFNWAPKSPFLYGSNMAIKREAWRQVVNGLCSARDIHEDVDLAIHLYRRGLKTIYNKKLLAKASGRRYNDSLPNFLNYIGMYRRTYRRHGMHSWAIYPAMFMWSLGYVLVHPWRRLWYWLYGLVSKKYPLQAQARKNPMQ